MLTSFTLRQLLLLGLCVPFLTSCSLLGVRHQVDQLDSRGSIAIQVSPAPRGPAPTYAVAWTTGIGGQRESAGFQRVGSDDLATFLLVMNRTFSVGAFTDENGNGAYDVGEPAGVIHDIQPLGLDDPSVKPQLRTIVLKRDRALPKSEILGIPQEDARLGGKLNLAVGEVVSLDDPRFVSKEGSAGLWRPADFLRDNTTGIYFTEPYDPARIPVVLVYGIGGSPQDWRYVIQHFDRTRHQVWFYQYPSGMRLGRVSGGLAGALRLLKQRHGFKECHVVAHSMGGLVARTAIHKAVTAEGANFIPRFVSISTPWGGHEAAESGLRHMKKPVPSWLDVAPDSDYLKDIYATPLPKGTQFRMLYGSTPRGPFWLGRPNDGTVTVKSETDPRVTRGALSVTHFPYSHMEMLLHPDTLARLQDDLR